jgi:hypothetical protein
MPDRGAARVRSLAVPVAAVLIALLTLSPSPRTGKLLTLQGVNGPTSSQRWYALASMKVAGEKGRVIVLTAPRPTPSPRFGHHGSGGRVIISLLVLLALGGLFVLTRNRLGRT